MKKFALLCLFGLLIIASSVSAQDDNIDISKCDMDTLNQVLKLYADSIQKVIDNKPTDPAKVSNFLQVTANLANTIRATCDNLMFSGKKQQVIGPVDIPEGVYRAVATTTGPLIVNVTITDGECESRTAGEEKGVFALQKGEADDGAESVFTSKGCTVLIETSLVRADWTLAFERINPK